MRQTFILLLLILSQHSFAQPSNKVWDVSKGGNGSDVPIKMLELQDGGYVMLAASSSGIGPDKTEPNRDNSLLTFDYWLIRFDQNGNKLWDKTFGGTEGETPTSLILMPDNGFLLGGYSYSSVGADKSDSCRGGEDFWIVKTDSLGNKLWDKTIGGTGVDYLYSMTITSLGRLILAGSTLSGIGGDKTSPQIATGSFDFWVLICDINGNVLVDKTYGGFQNDNCYSVVPATNGGVLLGGISESQFGGNKTENSRGLYDYWVIRITSSGAILWDKTYGGTAEDYMYTMQNGPNGTFLIGGDSYSPIGFEKTAAPKGSDDMWVLRIDQSGNVLWDKTYGSIDSDELNDIQKTADGGFLLTGESYSQAGDDKTENNLGVEQIWMVKIDSSGFIDWDKTFFTTGHDEGGMGLETSGGCYIGYIGTLADTGGYKTSFSKGGLDIWMSEICIPIVGVSSIVANNDFIIYPNPANELVYFKGIKENQNIVITNSIGKVVKSFFLSSQETSLDIRDLSNGIYFIGSENRSGVFKKLVIQH